MQSKRNKTEDIIFVSCSHNKYSHLSKLEVAGREEEKGGRGQRKRGIGRISILLRALLDITTSFFAFQDLREPRKGEVATGKVDRNEPGRYNIDELMEEISISYAVGGGIDGKE